MVRVRCGAFLVQWGRVWLPLLEKWCLVIALRTSSLPDAGVELLLEAVGRAPPTSVNLHGLVSFATREGAVYLGTCELHTIFVFVLLIFVPFACSSLLYVHRSRSKIPRHRYLFYVYWIIPQAQRIYRYSTSPESIPWYHYLFYPKGKR
jgi:hypothetical protein